MYNNITGMSGIDCLVIDNQCNPEGPPISAKKSINVNFKKTFTNLLNKVENFLFGEPTAVASFA